MGQAGRRRRRRRGLGLDVRFWSAHSWTWDDRLADPAIAARIDELASWLLEAAVPVAGGRPIVVDVGCGTGNHAVVLSTGAHVVGVDLSPAMLARAAAKGSATAATTAAFVRADLRDGLPVRAGAFDGALSAYAGQFLDLTPFLTELARTLRPGGTVVLELPRPAPRRRSAAGLSWRHRTFQLVNRTAAAAGRAAGVVRVRPAEDVDAALAAAGFTVVGHRDTDRSLAVLAVRRPD